MSIVTAPLDVGLKSVLVATDFSAASQKALYHALALARHFGAKFCLAHVIPWLPLAMVGPDAVVAGEDAVLRDVEHLQDNLARSGALAGLQTQFIIREGEVWRELETVIKQEQVDLVVVGTSGRRGVEKLVLGSVAEKIFRHADCQVLTVGPSTHQEPHVETNSADRVFLFATDFGEASLHALDYAVSCANHFAAKLALLHVVTEIPMPNGFRWWRSNDVTQMRESTRIASLRHLEELTRNAWLEPEFFVDLEMSVPVSDKILETAEKLKAGLIVMGLHRSRHVGTASHMPWATAYDVVCRARCPVLTVKR